MGVIVVHLRNVPRRFESIISWPGIYVVEDKSNERYIFVALTTRLEYRRYFSHILWHLLFCLVLMFSTLFCCRFDFNTVITGKSILYNLHKFSSTWVIVLFIHVRKYHLNQLRWNKHNCCVNNRVDQSWHSSPSLRCFCSGPITIGRLSWVEIFQTSISPQINRRHRLNSLEIVFKCLRSHCLVFPL